MNFHLYVPPLPPASRNDSHRAERGQAAASDLAPVEFGLRQEVEELLQSLGPLAHSAGLDLVGILGHDLPPVVVADPTRLRQILTILIKQAIQRTARGEIVVEVSTSSAAPASTVRLRFAVTDTGPSLTADRQRALLEQPPGELSLSMVVRLVEQMNSRLDIENQAGHKPQAPARGQGNTFAFTLALAAPAQTSPAEPELPPQFQGRSVLVADDSPASRRLLDDLLRHWELKPTVVEGGQAALQALQQARANGTPYAAFLLDARMPQMSGFAVAEKLVKSPGLGPPIVLLTPAPGRHSDEAYCRRLGIAARLTKPIRLRDLVSTLTEILHIPPPAPGVVPRPARPPAPPRITLAPLLRVLLVQNHPLEQRLLARLLEKRGHTVLAAHTGPEAASLLRDKAFDLVILDRELQDQETSQILTRLRHDPTHNGQTLPLILLGAERPEGTESCDAYLRQPVQAHELFATLDRLGQTSSGPHPPALDTTDIFDLPGALDRVDGDEILLLELTNLFFAEALPLLHNCQEALAARDAAWLTRPLELLRQGLTTLGASRALETTSRLQDLVQAGLWPEAGLTFQEFQKAVVRLQTTALEVLTPLCNL